MAGIMICVAQKTTFECNPIGDCRMIRMTKPGTDLDAVRKKSLFGELTPARTIWRVLFHCT